MKLMNLAVIFFFIIKFRLYIGQKLYLLATTYPTQSSTESINSECKEFENNLSCQSLALHRTCGYPAANPSKNLNAFCKELIHYIRCAKCRIFACPEEMNIVSVQKHIIIQEANYDTKCLYKLTSTSIDSTSLKNKIKSKKINTEVLFTTTKSVKTLKPIRLSNPSTSTKKMTTKTTSLDIDKIDEILKGNISNSYREYLYETKAGLRFHSKQQTTNQQHRKITEADIDKSKIDLNKTFKYTNQPIENTFVISTPNEFEDLNKDTNFPTIYDYNNSPILSSNKGTRKFFISDANNIVKTDEEPQQLKQQSNTEEFDLSNLDENSLEVLKNLTLETTNDITTDLNTNDVKSVVDAPKKLNQLSISFDHINVRNNTLKAISLLNNLTFDVNIINRTDIFKGVRNGAVYLHSKTYFTLNLHDHIDNFCITSTNSKNKLKRLKHQNLKTFEQININDSCEQGWTISFWIKVSNLNLFDKTIIRVDTFSNRPLKQYNLNLMKYLIIRISNFDIRSQFLYKKKLWTLTQNVIWKSEWSQLTFTWHEFEGLTIYINERKIFCQQQYDFYSHKEDKNNKMNSFNFADNYNDFLGYQYLFTKTTSLFDTENIGSNTNGTNTIANSNIQSLIYIGLNNKAKSVSRKMYWTNREEQNNILLTTAYAEAILIDELLIFNYLMDSKQILELYLKGILENFFNNI